MGYEMNRVGHGWVWNKSGLGVRYRMGIAYPTGLWFISMLYAGWVYKASIRLSGDIEAGGFV